MSNHTGFDIELRKFIAGMHMKTVQTVRYSRKPYPRIAAGFSECNRFLNKQEASNVDDRNGGRRIILRPKHQNNESDPCRR